MEIAFKFKKNDIIIILLVICIVMLIFNYIKIYRLNICEISSHSEFSDFQLRKLEDLSIKFKNYDLGADNTTKRMFTRSQSNNTLPSISEFIMTKTAATKIKSLQPNLEITQNAYATFSIGIPTIKRSNSSYLHQTLESLFFSMNAEEKENVLIVVLIAEVIPYYIYLN